MATGRIDTTDGDQVIRAAARGELSEQQINELFQTDPELARLGFIAATQAIQQLQGRRAHGQQHHPSTPSGQRPPYSKPNNKKKRKGSPGAKQGHTGHRRSTPQEPDRRQQHAELEQCPCCGERVHPARKHRKRMIVDLPEGMSTEATEHQIPRHWCGQCRRYVEPPVPDAMPKATLGHRAVVMTAWLHYGLGVSLSQVVEIMGRHLNTRLTPGGLMDAWMRMARTLEPWYRQIAAEALRASYLHADETGWRVDGQSHWLWCFTNPDLCYYMIDPSRGGPALAKFFTEQFNGVLITDFWRAYETLGARQQYCHAHLLRDLEAVDQHNDSAEWKDFAKRLRRLVRDAMRLRNRSDFTPERYQSRIQRIDRRVRALAEADYEDADARRLAKRLARTREDLWTFLDNPEIPYTNNFAERQLRPVVILRKTTQANRSEKGAATQAILMTVFRTLKLRGHHPVEPIAQALRRYVADGELPDLPPPKPEAS